MKFVIALLISGVVALGQQPSGKPAFEVADIRVSSTQTPDQGKAHLLPGGRLELHSFTVQEMIMGAWNAQTTDMIAGEPSWINVDRFDIVASAPGDPPRATLFLMPRSLLEDRFNLKIHTEDRPRSAYAHELEGHIDVRDRCERVHQMRLQLLRQFEEAVVVAASKCARKQNFVRSPGVTPRKRASRYLLACRIGF